MKIKTNLTILFVLMAFMSNAQQSTSDKSWKFLIEPYLMFPSMSGTTGIRELPPIEVDANTSDIFSNLEFGFMLYLEAQTDKWAIGSDFVYMKLAQDVTPTTLVNSGELTAKQLIWEFSGLYRILPFLEGGIGLRMNNMEMGADINRNIIGGGTTTFVSADNSEFWIDPVIIARATHTVNGKWLFQFRGDIGGFSIGSSLTWQLQGYFGYRFSKLFHTSVGFRAIGMDYDKGSGADRFRYDVTTFGPVVRLGFNL